MNKLVLLVMGVLLVNLAMAQTTISFFEEFPNESTLEKVLEIDFDTRIYLAANNLSEFYKYEQQIRNTSKHVQEVVYWPVLSIEEGYWISPWSDREALERIFIEMQHNDAPLEVMLDLEMPKKRSRMFLWGEFKENKGYISTFINASKDYNITITTVEKAWIPDPILKRFGLAFDSGVDHKRIKMFYSSFGRKYLPDLWMDKLFEKKMKKFKKREIIPAIGCIDVGIHGNEPLNSPEILKRELEIVRKNDLPEAVVFRFSGLNQEYLKTIQNVY
ncbi:MAG: hypothetical protein ABIA37_04975 [Candidatus Woesearchaeota archaeon]